MHRQCMQKLRGNMKSKRFHHEQFANITLDDRLIFYYIMHTALHKRELFFAPLLTSSTAVNKFKRVVYILHGLVA